MYNLDRAVEVHLIEVYLIVVYLIDKMPLKNVDYPF